MSYRVQAGVTNQNDTDWRQRVAKEERRLDQLQITQPDPFAHSLSTMLSGPGRVAQPHQKACGGAGTSTAGGSRAASVGGRSRASAAASRVSGCSATRPAAAPSKVAPTAAARRAASQISVVSWYKTLP